MKTVGMILLCLVGLVLLLLLIALVKTLLGGAKVSAYRPEPENARARGEAEAKRILSDAKAAADATFRELDVLRKEQKKKLDAQAINEKRVEIVSGINEARDKIGVRDETGIYGGIAVCGQVLCCSRFLKEFSSINVKMAKEQDLMLTPATISGVCGRLKCCLKYEHEGYMEMEKNF